MQGIVSDVESCRPIVEEAASTVAAVQSPTSELLETYKQARQAVTQQAHLADLLDVSQLMDTCTRNGLYVEALELVRFATDLFRRHRLHRVAFEKLQVRPALCFELSSLVWVAR